MAAFSAQPERAAPTPHADRNDELGEAQSALADMQRGLSNALRHKQRLAALGEAVSRISHDLRNALSTARLLSDRLTADHDPRVRDLGARIVRSVDRAARLAESTLRFGAAADADAQPQTVPLRPALDDAAEEAAPAGGAEWRNNVDADCAVRCDPEHLHRIVLNLLRNAQTAMQGREPARITAAAARRGAMVRITVADTGPGLSDHALARLFQPFANGRGDHEGSGLGLAIARDLARANGGELRLAHSGPDGAAFDLDLPAA
jgi:signal transduction histidine kinase